MAVGYKNGKRVLVETVETTKPVYKLVLSTERQTIKQNRYFVPLYATYANAPSGTNIENIEKNSIYGTFGTEMPHGTLAQVAQTSYMKGEFLYQLFIIMSINHQGDSLLSL